MEKLIIEAAINEQSPKEQNPHVPYGVDECIAEAIACADAGAAIVHFHARDPVSGDLLVPGTETYADVMRVLRRERPGMLFYPTYSPGDGFSHIEALAKDPEVRLPVATIDPGATNFSFYDPADRRVVGDFTLSVSHADAALFFDICSRHGVRYSVVVREPGHVRTTVAYHRSGLIGGKILFKVNLGDTALFGLPPTPAAVDAYMDLVPDDIAHSWMIYIYGPSHWAMAEHAIATGGHVRTGIGDNVTAPDGAPHRNVELVRRVVERAGELGRAVATPSEALEMLGG